MSAIAVGRSWARGRAASFAWVVLAYLVAGVVGFGVARAAGGGANWQTVALADAAATGVVFAFSLLLNNSSVYDPYWSVAPMAIAPALALAAPGADPWRRAIVTTLVLAWGARLTWNWARGWAGLSHEDWRYVDLREKTGPAYWLVSLLGLHFMPTLSVYLGCLSLLPALVQSSRPVGPLDAVAFLVTAGAIALETVADEQLRAFRKAPHPPGRILDTGLWSVCRHPNYLGEITFWWGLLLFALAADPGALCALAGPAWITGLFVFVSVPLIDRRSLSRRPGYAEHMKRVPGLFPRPWKRG